MANTNVSHDEVKSIVDSLECSPSKNQPTSPIYSKGEEPQAAKKSAGKASADKAAEKPFPAGRNRAAKGTPKGS